MSLDALPRPGLGTSGNDDHEECAETVAAALEAGYRHVDTAQMYDNEAAVGEGLDRAAVDRDEVVVATKIHPSNLAYDDVHETFAESRDRLGVEVVDLLYVHWPVSAYEPEATLQAFDELYDEGAIRAVGVSNFTPDLLEEARDLLDAPIAAHQVECHPLLPQRELREHAREDDHDLVAYAPIGQADILVHPVLTDVADDHDATPAQVCLAWLMADERVVPIPKGRGEHVHENLAARDLDLSADAIDRIDAIDERRRLVDPDAAPWNA